MWHVIYGFILSINFKVINLTLWGTTVWVSRPSTSCSFSKSSIINLGGFLVENKPSLHFYFIERMLGRKTCVPLLFPWLALLSKSSTFRTTFREKCPNTEFFLLRIQSECGKIWPEKTLYLDTFLTVTTLQCTITFS